MIYSLMMKEYLTNLCPVNLFRPSFPDLLNERVYTLYEKIYNNAIAADFDGFNGNLRLLYSLGDTVYIHNFDQMCSLYFNDLKDKSLSLSQLLIMNRYGCVLSTSGSLYRDLHYAVHGISDGNHHHTMYAMVITVLLSVCYLL